MYRPFLDLTSNGALETLCLVNVDLIKTEQDTVPLILGGVRSSIKELILNTTYGAILGCNWSGLQGALARPAFSTLRSFSFHVELYESLQVEGIEMEIEELLGDTIGELFPPGVFSVHCMGSYK